MIKFLKNILFIVYIVIAITVTILLLSYNEYMCSEIAGYTICIVRDDEISENFKSGDLLIIKQSKPTNISENDRIILYRDIGTNDYTLRVGEVTSKIKYGGKIIYNIDNNAQYDSSYLIGKEDEIIVIKNVGTIISILESRWGYLFSIVIVTLLLLLQELYEFFIELKYGSQTNEVKESK